MKIEHKSFELELKAAEEETKSKGVIRGYASTFGNVDLGGDRVRKGAFKKSLKETKGIIPILADHNPSKQIGWGFRTEEDEKGLYVEGEIDLENSEGKSKWNLAKRAVELGGKMGLSIGYMTIRAEAAKDNPTIRELTELKLFEYSIVTFPMNTEAMVTAAKNFHAATNLQAFANEIRIKAQEMGLSLEALVEEALRPRAAASESSAPGNHPELLASIERLKGMMTI